MASFCTGFSFFVLFCVISVGVGVGVVGGGQCWPCSSSIHKNLTVVDREVSQLTQPHKDLTVVDREVSQLTQHP